MIKFLEGKFVIHIILLILLFMLIYLPMSYLALLSFSESSIYPFPIKLTIKHYLDFFSGARYRTGLTNSAILAAGTGFLAIILTGLASWGLHKYKGKAWGVITSFCASPVLIPKIFIGLSLLMFWNTLGIKRSLITAIVGNVIYASAFALLIMLVQYIDYPRTLDEIAACYGASPFQIFKEVTLPIIWPGLLASFLISFILSFNNFIITFFNLGATPTIPTIVWGSIRHGIDPQLYALSTFVLFLMFMFLTFLIIAANKGWIRFTLKK